MPITQVQASVKRHMVGLFFATTPDAIKSKAIASVAVWTDVQLYETSDLTVLFLGPKALCSVK